MTVIGEAVDDRNAGVPRHVHDDVMGEGADHDPLHHALQVLGDVIDRLSLAQTDLGRRKIQRMPAQFLDAHVEGHACAQ